MVIIVVSFQVPEKAFVLFYLCFTDVHIWELARIVTELFDLQIYVQSD
jgi:hypothetical protein